MSDYTTPSSILAITGSGKIGNQSPYKNDSNEAFLGEKFEFSSVLRSKVDSVEKTYSDAQNPKKPIDTSLPAGREVSIGFFGFWASEYVFSTESTLDLRTLENSNFSPRNASLLSFLYGD